MKITVTKEDIENGIRSSNKFCPIALALKRAGYKDAIVRTIEFLYDCGNAGCNLPLEAQKFIYSFDVGKPVKPFTFSIEDTLVTYGG